MERLTKRITENQIELSAKANPTQYVDNPQRVHMKHPFWNVFDRLCKYEDLEEQGLLLKLPCKVGDTVYDVKELVTQKGYYIVPKKMSKIEWILVLADDFGKTIFLTKEEAKRKLKELQEKEN